MAKKYLPIKIIHKRKKDASLNEARGSSDTPEWMKSINIEERSVMVNSTLNEISEVLKNRSKRLSFIPATLELTLDNKATSKTYRTKIRSIVDVQFKNNIIGLKDNDKLLVKIENSNDLGKIRNNISDFKKSNDGLASIVESNIFTPNIQVKDKEILKVKLINYHDTDINNAVHTAFLESCESNGIDVHTSKYTPELTVYQIPFEESSFAILQEFHALASIEDMPNFDSLSLSDISEELNETIVLEPDPSIDYPIIGVIDSGIARNPYMSPWIEDSHSPYIEEDKNSNHGSAVASVLIYGDHLEGKEFSSSNGSKIYDACVLPKKELRIKITEADLIQQIIEAIENRPDINIWNMSIGWNIEASPSKMSDFGAALDDLSDKHNLLVSTSVGNCYNFRSSAPPGKLQVSSDSVRAISVASIAHCKNEFDDVEINYPSPFSRKGPGPFGIIKPELTHYGGNAGEDEFKSLKVSGVKVIASDGSTRTKGGTSYSTPRVTSILSALESELNEPFDPLLYKALAIHSASYPDIEMDQNNKMDKMGFGVPANARDILYNSENEITLVIRDTIEKGNFIEILDLPFPKDMVEDGFYYGEIVATLVSSPHLDISQGQEYCQANIDVLFGTYDEKIERKGKRDRNPIGRNKSSKNLLAPTFYGKTGIKENKSFDKHRILKSYHQSFQPVKKWAINLAEMKPAEKLRHLEYPKLWYLKIVGLFRDHFQETKEDVSTDFCLILTIKDPKEKHKVYATVSQELDQNNFIQQDIKVKTQIQLKA